VNAQPSLFDGDPQFAPIDTRGLTIGEAFTAFHEANGWVYDALVTLARRWTATGRTRIGIKALFEVLRWEWSLATTGDTFRLNNSWTSRYARLIAAQEPDLADVFETRELRAA
jgi:hypothetical protein